MSRMSSGNRIRVNKAFDAPLVVPVVATSKIISAPVLPPSADMHCIGRDAGPEELQGAKVLLESVMPNDWKSEARKRADDRRGLHQQIDVQVSSPHSELHLRTYTLQGYYNQFPGPYFEAVLDGTRFSEDQARELYLFAETTATAVSEKRERVVNELFAHPARLEDARWTLEAKGTFETTVEGLTFTLSETRSGWFDRKQTLSYPCMSANFLWNRTRCSWTQTRSDDWVRDLYEKVKRKTSPTFLQRLMT